MNSNGITAIVVVAVIAMSVGAVHFMGESADPNYSVLDTTDNLAAGQVFTKTSVIGPANMTISYKIDKIENGEVSYTITSTSAIDTYEKRIEGFDYFDPANYYIFDYTDSSAIPAGMTVTKDGDIYILNGNHESAPTVTTYENFRITNDGTAVTNVEGKMSLTTNYEGASSKQILEYITDAGVLKAKAITEGVSTASGTPDNFLNQAVGKVSATNYPEELEKTETKGVLNGYEVTIITLNGTYTDGESSQTFVNMKYYSYNGYLVKAEGKFNNNIISSEVTITV